MDYEESIKKWRKLEPISQSDIQIARDYAHQALQFLSGTAISYIPKRTDDSHTNTEWSRNLNAFVSNLFGEEYKFCLGLNITELKLLFLKENWSIIDEFKLDNKNFKQVTDWLKQNLKNHGLDEAKFTMKRHYEIPVNGIENGEVFKVKNNNAFTELAKYYSNADLILRTYTNNLSNATPVRCWPHHFDIATLLNIGNEKLQSIGVGLSPGDFSHSQPYFYVTMWPYPELNEISFPELSVGKWQSSGWIGAALTSDELTKLHQKENQFSTAFKFIEESAKMIQHILLPNI